MQDESEEKFLSESVCVCKGSLKIHETCYHSLREIDDLCKICKTKFKSLTVKSYNFINGLAIIREYPNDYSPFFVIYTVNEKYQKHGIQYFYEAKKLKCEIPYENGIKNGVEKHYEDGRLVSSISYQNDMLHGIMKSFNNDVLIYELEYNNGKLINKKYYNHTAKLQINQASRTVLF